MLLKIINWLPIHVFIAALFFYTISADSEEIKQSDIKKIDIKPFEAELFKLPDSYTDKLKDYRKKWTRLTGFEYSQLHWDHFMVVYINQNPEIYRNNNLYYMRQWSDDLDDDTEIESSVSGFQKYPVNTVVLKENFTVKEGIPDSASLLTFMVKRADGYDPDYGNWEYIQSTPDGRITFRGNSNDVLVKQACISCHVNIKERDYIFSNVFTGRALE